MNAAIHPAGHCPVESLHPHPLARHVDQEAVAFRELARSIGGHGVLVPLVVCRGLVLDGNRRLAAASQCGLETVPAMLCDAWPEETAEGVLVELARWWGPVDQARLARKLLEKLGNRGKVAARFGQSLEWLELRLGLLTLPDEVQAAVESEDADRRLPIDSVAEILRLPACLFKDACRLVLSEAVSRQPRHVRDALEEKVRRPWLAADGWNLKYAAAAVEKWRSRLLKFVEPDDSGALECVAVPWHKRIKESKHKRPALLLVPRPDLSEIAPISLRWVALAAKVRTHVLIVPEEDGIASKALVDHSWIMHADRSTKAPWTAPKERRRTIKDPRF